MRLLIIICSFVFASSGFIVHPVQAEAVGDVATDPASTAADLLLGAAGPDPTPPEPSPAPPAIQARPPA